MRRESSASFFGPPESVCPRVCTRARSAAAITLAFATVVIVSTVASRGPERKGMEFARKPAGEMVHHSSPGKTGARQKKGETGMREERKESARNSDDSPLYDAQRVSRKNFNTAIGQVYSATLRKVQTFSQRIGFGKRSIRYRS